MVREEIASAKQLSGEVNVPVILEEPIVVESKGMFNPAEDDFFIFNMVNVLGRNDFCFFHCLNGILLARISLQPTHFDIAERAY